MTSAESITSRVRLHQAEYGYASVQRSCLDRLALRTNAEQNAFCEAMARDLHLYAAPGVMCVTFFKSRADYTARGGR